jgi:uncharacterized membrane protein
MIREKLIDKGIGDNKKLRWRSHEISRSEGLSDAVFGFAVTLLVVSLEVPKTYTTSECGYRTARSNRWWKMEVRLRP